MPVSLRTMLSCCKEVAILITLCALPQAAGISWISRAETAQGVPARSAYGSQDNPRHNEFTLTEVFNSQDGQALSTNYLAFHDLLPDSLRLHFRLYSTTIAMRLRRSRDVDASFPTIVSSDRQFSRHQPEISTGFGVYYDQMLQASLVLEPQVAQNGTFRRVVRGSFKIANNEYIIEHLSLLTEDARESFLRNAYRGYGHRFRRSSTSDVEDYLVVRQETNKDTMPGGDPLYRPAQQLRDQYAREMEKYLNDPARYSQLQRYTVEVMLFVDYGVFRKWWELATETNSRRREYEVVDNLRYYFAHVMNGVNLRFSSIADQVNYHIKLSGLFISTTTRDSPWTTRRLVYEAGDPWPWVSAYDTLDSFELWMEKNKPSLPRHDVGMLFVGYQLFGLNYDDTRRPISGLANLATLCEIEITGGLDGTVYKRDKSTLVAWDHGFYGNPFTSAHELGHILGANHDGTANSCTGRDQFIMASSPGALNDQNYLNPFTFSQCTIRAFRNHLNYLNLVNKNCLLNEAANDTGYNIEDELRTPPGQRFDIHEQCKVINGRDSYYCGGHYNDMMSCRLMECFDPLEGKCVSRIEQVAANGTTCGNRKWCLLNDCIFDERAPPAIDYCRSGDYRGSLPDGKSCKDVKGPARYNCYNAIYKDQCCDTCDRIRNVTRPDCPWGDRDPWCKTIVRRDCYADNVKKTCCNYCEENTNLEIKDCKYGDRASWCRTMKRSSCYVNSHTCCETCARYKSLSNPQCPFGDKATWCPTIPRRQCYNTDRMCCQTCGRHHTGRKGCEYGDKSRYCSNVNCKDPYYQRVCCSTCGYYITTRPPPPSTPAPTRAINSPTPGSPDRLVPSTTIATDIDRITSDGPASGVTNEWDLAPDWDFEPISPYVPDAEAEQDSDVTVGNTTESCTDKASWCANVFPGRCYSDSDICCKACSAYRTFVGGCEYGDHFEWCESRNLRFCNSSAQNREDCCATCGQLDKEVAKPPMMPVTTTLETTTTRPTTTTTKSTTTTTTTTTRPTTTTTSPTTTTTTQTTTSTTVMTTTLKSGHLSCPKGDMATWCRNRLYRAVCYTHPDICCETCNARYTGDKGCEYGDKASWCGTVTSSSCLTKDPAYNDTCCQTCGKLIKAAMTTTTTTTPTTTTTSATTKSSTTTATTASTTGASTSALSTNEPTTTRRLRTPPSTQAGSTTPIDERSKPCPHADTALWCLSLPSTQCYRLYDRCCDSCAKFYTGKTGCEFGDRHNQCHRIKAAYCYYDVYQRDCCERCEQLNSGDPECPWGDIHDQCEAVDCRDPIQGPMCCETCKKRRLSTTLEPTTVLPPKPECADKASWCSTMPARDCYVDESICCPTCKKHYTGIKGCEYQDKVSWCRDVVEDIADCDMPNVKTWCCYTCTMLGYFPPEQIHRIREGVVIGVQDSSLQEIIRNVPVMLDYLLTSVNMYCLENLKDCCSFFHMVPRFNPKSTGRPFKIDFEVTRPINGQTMNFKQFNDREIVFFVLVQLTGNNLSPYCTESSNSTNHRLKRELTNTVYLNSATVFNILNQNKFNLEELFHWRVVRIEIPSAFYREGTNFPSKWERLSQEPEQKKDQYLLGVVIALAVALVAVSVSAILLWVKHKRSMYDNDSVRQFISQHDSLGRASSISQFSASSSSSLSGSLASYNSRTSIKRMDEISRSLASLQPSLPNRSKIHGSDMSPMSFRETSMICFENPQIKEQTVPNEGKSNGMEVERL